MSDFFKICIDAGHGMANRRNKFFDPGAVAICDGKVVQEADIVLSIALLLGAKLRELGVPFFLSRVDNTTPTPLAQRTRVAKKNHCNYFLTLHCNAADSKLACGYEVLYNPRSASKDFAQYFLRLASDLELSNRGLKRREDLAVLNNLSYAGAALVELGFLSNKEDRSTLLNEQEAIAESLSQIILEVKKNYEKNK
jgi:N-acetylmuramoyl-L-alanine amidase